MDGFQFLLHFSAVNKMAYICAKNMAVASLKSWDNFILEFSKITPESAPLSTVNPDYAQEKETAKFTYHRDRDAVAAFLLSK